ncbi:hypothetical protein OPIT5_26895 [Opitutaceae bacterium TAV5]|nr:hypothetical protein OPIT5_26895 [Opitutaceae bacterium TAV5]
MHAPTRLRFSRPITILSSLLSVVLASALHAQLNTKEDGGAAVYAATATSAPRPAGSLVSPAIAARFPLAQQARIHVLGGAVRGFGMLARYPENRPPSEIVVARKTTPGGQEPFTPVALVRVFDPAGNLVAVEEFTDQATPLEIRTLKISSSGAATTAGAQKLSANGIWRVSFSGGRSDDIVEIRLPRTDIWGVRGEMSLGLTDAGTSLPPPFPVAADGMMHAWLWAPPPASELLIGIETGSTDGIELRDSSGSASLATPENDPAGRAGRLLLSARSGKPLPLSVAGQTVRLSLPRGWAGTLVVDGAPGLLCPTPEAAALLKGGMVESHGLWVAGPLQARAREWMIATLPTLQREPAFVFPQKIPDGLDNLLVHALGFGKYSPLNNLDWMVRRQNENADPLRAEFCSERPPLTGDAAVPLRLYPPPVPPSFFMAGSLAAAVAFHSPLNPAQDNPELVRRAALVAFANIAAMQGDDLLRENPLVKSRYPLTHAFFSYDGAGSLPYELLKDKLPPEVRAIWREGVMALGDKLADHQAYQSNQWAHVLRGHLNTWLATGEKRFLGYFERQMRAYLDNTFGPGSKFGQHAAGYYLEEFGPDGNYDKLNSFCIDTLYFDYREIPGADPVLVKKLHDAIEKNLRFNSFFWLPQPDGSIAGPTAINCRTTAYLGGGGYPGCFLPKAEYPLAAARFALTPEPARGIGDAGTFSYYANTEKWARECIEVGLAKGASAYDGPNGNWLPYLVKAWSLPQKASPAALPCRSADASWQLPGLLAWNRHGVYGLVFADVTGTAPSQRLTGITGGAPTALWSPAFGTFLSSMHSGYPHESARLSKPEELTFACIFGQTADNRFFFSGKERATIAQSSSSPDRFDITSKPATPFSTLTWSYDTATPETTIAVRLDSLEPVREAFVSLPLFIQNRQFFKTRIENGTTLVIENAKARLFLTWTLQPQKAAGSPLPPPAGQLLPSTRNDIERLVIPLPADGSALTFSLRSETL